MQSDLVLSQLKKHLDEEGEGKQRQRGITTTDPGLQTYEIFFPLDVREQYDTIFKAKLSLKKLSDLKKKKVAEEKKRAKLQQQQ